MRNVNSQRTDTMIRVRALQQAVWPHVSHAETGGCVTADSCRHGLTATRIQETGALRLRNSLRRRIGYQTSRRPALRLAHHEVAKYLHPRH